jgi:hydrogenase small subunit
MAMIGFPEYPVPPGASVGEVLRQRGVDRRQFLKLCGSLASLLALPAGAAAQMAAAVAKARRPSVIWLSFQECTGCTEALTRSHTPSLESLLFDLISLDYHHTLQAAAGEAAEAAREAAMQENAGRYLLVVDGSVPLGNPGYSTIAGVSNLEMLKQAIPGAAAVIAMGTCAAYGGLPAARPNPTGAVSIAELAQGKPVVNIPGCPPIPVVMTGVIAHYLAFGTLPDLDALGRPKAFYGETIHDRCYRRPFYDQGKFAETFDDEGARQGWCLFKLGCKGPVTYNACATTKWNAGVSFPIQSGHGCIGCAEPRFWDMGGLYQALPQPTGPVAKAVGTAAAAGAAAGVAVTWYNRSRQKAARAGHQPVKVEDLEK